MDYGNASRGRIPKTLWMGSSSPSCSRGGEQPAAGACDDKDGDGQDFVKSQKM